MGQKLFTSGEFAKFCNTTKDTLFTMMILIY